jgi:hypothetical protein
VTHISGPKRCFDYWRREYMCIYSNCPSFWSWNVFHRDASNWQNVQGFQMAKIIEIEANTTISMSQTQRHRDQCVGTCLGSLDSLATKYDSLWFCSQWPRSQYKNNFCCDVAENFTELNSHSNVQIRTDSHVRQSTPILQSCECCLVVPVDVMGQCIFIYTKINS